VGLPLPKAVLEIFSPSSLHKPLFHLSNHTLAMQPESSSGQSTPETLDNTDNTGATAPPVKRRRISSSWNQTGKKPTDQSQDATEHDGDSAMPDASVNGTSTISAMQPPVWQATIEKAVQSIVSIRASQVAAFDTERKCFRTPWRSPTASALT
jgi:hypothetical protein